MPNIPIKDIILNYSNNDLELIDRIKYTFNMYGQIRPVYVREDYPGYELVEGSAIYLAMKELGEEEINAITLYDAKDEEVLLINVILNHGEKRTSIIKMAEKIKQISHKVDVKKIAKFLEYDEQTVEDLIALLEFDWSDFEVNAADTQINLLDLAE